MQKIGTLWLSVWLYIIVAVAGIIVSVMTVNWSVWTMQTKLVAMETALLAFHVLEEWHFPGGFHVMYNLLAEDNIPDRYPMNQMSDMWTNFIGILFGCVCLTVGVTPVFVVMQLLLCFAEIHGHVSSGILMKKRFTAQGKKTIYNPGLFPTVFGYLPIAVGLVFSFFLEQAPTTLEILSALVCGAVLGAIALPGAERVFRDKNTPYAYTWGHGYFETYMK